jgi:hypothetical protein
MPSFLKYNILKEFNEIRGGVVGATEARLLGEPISAELEPAEHEDCDELFPLLV